jgi:hypothetical protein
MKNLNLNKILFFMLAFAANNLFGQSVLKIADIKIVSAGETLTIPAGTVVEFGSGAFLKIEGSLIVNGTESNPVIFKNMEENISGLGIAISGSNYESVVVLNNVKFDGLIQPLRFDPFWQRKEVELKNISFWNSISGEPLVYVASPLTDLREGRKIVFTIENSTCVNNSAGMLLENVGSDAIQYNIDNLSFLDNNATGNANALGLLHFDFASLYKSTNIKVGSLSFTRNYALNNPLGVSVGGNGAFTMNIDTIYQTDLAEDIIYDKHIDNRIPAVIVDKKLSINENGSTDIIKSISHNFGQITLNVYGNPAIAKLIDSTGNKVDYTTSRKGDTIQFDYLQGIPVKGVLANGQQVNIPKFIANNDKFLELTKIDTAQYYKFLIEKNIVRTGQAQAQSDLIGFKLKLPIFKRKGEIVKKLNTWEVGVWGGGAMYGGGDISPTSTIPSTIELSFGLYQQLNINTRFSMKISGYYSTISSHNFLAAGFFSGTKPIYFYDSLYKRIKVSSNFLPVNFITKMGLLEFEGLWHLSDYQINVGKRSKIIPSIGLSVGIMYFTPYRIAFVEGQSKTETRDDWENKMYTKHLWNLRLLGSEGQNFLPGKSPYSPLAFNLGTSFSLTYLKKRYILKGEMKVAYTSTDYLDDYGPGIWYGGDYDKMVSSAYKLYDNIPQADMNAITWTPNSNKQKRVGWINPRSTDGLNDWYYQLHLGMSYRLFK